MKKFFLIMLLVLMIAGLVVSCKYYDVDVELQEINVVSTPTNKQFLGKAFDRTGMVVMGYYNKGNFKCEIKDYSVNPSLFTTTGSDVKVEISYQGKTCYTYVDVVEEFSGYKKITNASELKSFLETTKTDAAEFGILESDITFDKNTFISINGKKTLEFNNKTIKMSADNFSGVMKEKTTGFDCSTIVINQDATVEFKNGKICVSYTGTAPDEDEFSVVGGIDKFYFSVIYNQGNLIADNMKIEGESSVSNSKTITVTLTGIYNRFMPSFDTSWDDAKTKDFKAITCDVKNNSVIDVKNTDSKITSEAHGIMGWQNTTTKINNSTISVAGNAVKGVMLCTHDTCYTKDYAGTIYVKNSTFNVNADKGSAHAFMLMTCTGNDKETGTCLNVSDCNVVVTSNSTTKTPDVFKIQYKSNRAFLIANSVAYRFDSCSGKLYSAENCGGESSLIIDGTLYKPE